MSAVVMIVSGALSTHICRSKYVQEWYLQSSIPGNSSNAIPLRRTWFVKIAENKYDLCDLLPAPETDAVNL